MTLGLNLLAIAAGLLALLLVLVVVALLITAVVGVVILVRDWLVARNGGAGTGGSGETMLFGMRIQEITKPEQRIYAWPLAASIVGLVLSGLVLFANDADAFVVPMVGLLAISLIACLLYVHGRVARWDRRGLVLLGFDVALILGLLILPTYLYGWQLNGAIHRSAVSGPLLLLISVATMSWSLRGLLGGTPTAQDVSFYPVVAVPVLIALVAYALLLGRVVVQGVGGLSWDLLTTAWGPIAGGGYEAGLRTHILGTLLLMALTCLLSIGPGVAVGIFMSEYPGRIARVIGFSTTMLRAMSVFIIGIAALGFVGLANGLPANSLLSQLMRGSFILPGGTNVQPGTGSFVAAAVFLSLLVIPIIAKMTEEGLRSVPQDIREGSVAVGATDEYGLRRILLPWAAPNIVTGVLLGAAEAAGSLAIIMFIAGNGENGLGPLSSVTSLDFALFSTRYGTQPFIASMGYRAPVDYAYTSALLLLIITLGLTIVAMLVRRRFSKRYRGSLTVG